MTPSTLWAARLAPEPLRDFLPYTSASALKVIHASEVLSRALDVAKHVSRPAERAREAARLEHSLHAAGLGNEIRIVSAPGPRLLSRGLCAEDRTMIGQRVLDLYFHLLHWDGPLFLDLRPRHFSWDAGEQQLSFYPSGLWCRADAEFMDRLRSLYVGFYQADPQALARGIELYSWKTQPKPGFPHRIERLLHQHFGSGVDGYTRFAIEQFRATFDAIFEEVAQSRAKLHPDLTFLGVELVGLYLTLESLDVALDSRSAFEGAR